MKDICILRDPKIIKALSDDLGPIRRAKTAEERKAAVEEYKKKHAANLHYLIDPDHPDFGPKNNQLVYGWGRKKGGRSDFQADSSAMPLEQRTAMVIRRSARDLSTFLGRR